jgi:hypothetical protein
MKSMDPLLAYFLGVFVGGFIVYISNRNEMNKLRQDLRFAILDHELHNSGKCECNECNCKR